MLNVIRALIFVAVMAAVSFVYHTVEFVPPHGTSRTQTINATDRTLIRIGDKFYYWGFGGAR